MGVGLWMWTAMFFPNYWMWGIGTSIRYNLLFTVLTVASFVFSSEHKKLILADSGKLIMLFLFCALASSFLTVGISEVAMEHWIRFAKVVALFFFLIYIFNKKEHIDFFLWCLVFSLGFFGFIEGLKFIASGGGHKIEGMQGHALGDRNELSLAIVMFIPLCSYLMVEYGKNVKAIKIGLFFLIILCVFTVLGTHSRGGLISLIFLSAVYFFKSKRKLTYIISISLLLFLASSYIPEEWLSRMNTIEDADKDASFMGRVVAWKLSFIMALDNPIFGGGIKSLETWPVWASLSTSFHDSSFAWFYTGTAVPDPNGGHAAHSIYFQVLGEQGFLGLFIFLMIGYTSIKRIRRIEKIPYTPDWMIRLIGMLKLSIFCYFLGGAALSFAYFDLIYALFGILIVLEYKILPQYEESLQNEY